MDNSSNKHATGEEDHHVSGAGGFVEVDARHFIDVRLEIVC